MIFKARNDGTFYTEFSYQELPTIVALVREYHQGVEMLKKEEEKKNLQEAEDLLGELKEKKV